MIALLLVLLKLAHAHSGCESVLKAEYGPISNFHKLATERLPDINSFIEANLSPTERVYFAKIGQAARAAVGKHHSEALKGEPSKKDLPRHATILKAIAEFNPQNPKFSLYKIKRAIEGRYSLNEYVNCQ